MRRTKEEAERTRKSLMDAGLRIFGKKGYAAARLSEIASEAGVTRGAVYWHFGSKKELMFAILREMANPYIALALEVLESDAEPHVKIRVSTLRVMEAMERTGLFLTHEQMVLRFMAEHPDEFREHQVEMLWSMRKVIRLFKRTIREAQDTGKIRADVDANVIAGTFMAVMRGSAIMKSIPKMDMLHRGSSGAVVELLMTGLEPRRKRK